MGKNTKYDVIQALFVSICYENELQKDIEIEKRHTVKKIL